MTSLMHSSTLEVSFIMTGSFSDIRFHVEIMSNIFYSAPCVTVRQCSVCNCEICVNIRIYFNKLDKCGARFSFNLKEMIK